MARRYLVGKGYEIVESNYRTRHGELDLILRQDDTLVIVEVKLRRGTAYVTPLEAVTPRKQQAVRLMAEQYLAARAPGFRPCASTWWASSSVVADPTSPT